MFDADGFGPSGRQSSPVDASGPLPSAGAPARPNILDPAAGAVGSITTVHGYNPYEGRHVLIDISGLAHIAAP